MQPVEAFEFNFLFAIKYFKFFTNARKKATSEITFASIYGYSSRILLIWISKNYFY